jgi:pimeloyl-ACP methyl ester carboxylesterase
VARAAAGLFVAIVVLAIAGIVLQARAVAAERRAFPAPGRLVDAGGYTLHLHCSGEGSPTVVLEMGAGAWSIHAREVQRGLSTTTRTCAYDRAGYGWSESGPEPRTAEHLAMELHALLAAADESGPFVLAGHSLGGWVVRIYQDRFPNEVAGLALIDSAHERQWEELPSEVGAFLDRSSRVLPVMRLMVRLGVIRWLLPQWLPAEDLGPELSQQHRAGILRPSWWGSVGAETGSARESAAQAAATGKLGELPLTVVTAGRSFDAFRGDNSIPYEEADRVWMRLQEELVLLSTESRHFLSPEASHDIYRDDPGLVVQGILDVVQRARTRAATDEK